MFAESFESRIEQNLPNPFKDYTKIEFYIDDKSHSAYMQVCDMMGRTVEKVILKEKGNDYIFLDRSHLPKGIYLYSLIVDNLLIDTKRMVIED